MCPEASSRSQAAYGNWTLFSSLNQASLITGVVDAPIPENSDRQVGWGAELPDLIKGVPALCGRIGLDELYRSLATQTILLLGFALHFYPPRPQPVLGTAPR